MACKMPLHVNIGKQFYSNRFTWCSYYQRWLNKMDEFVNKLGISHGLIRSFFVDLQKNCEANSKEIYYHYGSKRKISKNGSKLSENSQKINQQQTILATFSMLIITMEQGLIIILIQVGTRVG